MSITTYTRSNGETVPIKEMNDHHLLAAIKKMKRDGYVSAADISLLASVPGHEQEMKAMAASDVLTALEAEKMDRGLHD